MKRLASALLALALVAIAGGAAVEAPPADYASEIRAWRDERAERLRAEDGWLSLIGLHWLEEGDNPFGSAPGVTVPLPAGAAPARGGLLRCDGKKVELIVEPGVELTVNGEAVARADLRDDSEGNPDVVRLGRLLFYVIQRDGRHAVRVKDPEAPTRKEFRGIDYFPIDAEYRVVGRFVRYDQLESVEVPTVAGTKAAMLVPGRVEFSLQGKPWTLRPLVEDASDSELFFIFKDRTSGRETYGAGRYLYGTLKDGEVVLDFNKAYNPPCAFTKFATCPLPPRGNRLALRVEAGERKYGDH